MYLSVSRIHECFTLAHLGLDLLNQRCPVVYSVGDWHHLMQLPTSWDV